MKTFKITISSFILVLFSMALQAGGGGTIKGNVVDESGFPIPAANVFIEVAGQLRGSHTDLDGKFTIKPIPPGNYDLFITSMGFDSIIIKNVRVIDDRITMFRDQEMAIKSFDHMVDIIEWTIPLIDMVETGAEVFGAAEVEKLPNRNDFTTMISTMTAGVYQKEEGDPLQMRGSRSGASTYFIDGVKISDLNAGMPSASIGTIRVYTGGIPAQYGDVTGGIVVVETKSFMSWYKKK